MTVNETIQAVAEKDTSGAPVMTVRRLCKAFGTNPVLNDFNFILRKGESVAVLGKSGSGKSVFIKCVIGLLKPDRGEINVLGKDIARLRSDELDRLRTKIGFLFQSNALYDSMTVRENLEFPLRRHWIRLTAVQTNDRVMKALTNVGLADTVNMMPSELSGGMRKRIALARTLILEPEIILYDEPTTGLDPITSREISNLMVEITRKYNTSSVIISHDMNCIRATTDRIIMLINGRSYAEGTYEGLKQITDPKVKQFFE
jgi:phospholipid/cholesterol/gamma-HCH transport system ATP-binding protein